MNRKIVSLVYLVLGTLGLVGFLAHFNQWPQPFNGLFLLALPYYLATLTFTIFVHPLICTFILRRRMKNQERKADVVLHLVWSIMLVATWWLLILNGYYLSA